MCDTEQMQLLCSGSISPVPLPVTDGILPWKQCTNSQSYDYNCSYCALMLLFPALLMTGRCQATRKNTQKRCQWELQLLCRAAASQLLWECHCRAFLRAWVCSVWCWQLRLSLGSGVCWHRGSVAELPGCSRACWQWGHHPSPHPLSCTARGAFILCAFFTKKADLLFL